MPLLALALAAAGTVAAPMPQDIDLKAECARVAQVYPRLMLAAMAEGPMDCGDPERGESVDCAAGETPEQKQAHALRWEIRKYQEAGYKTADTACGSWRAHPKSPEVAEAARVAIVAARARDKATAVPPARD
ncbi:hypothetical protein [Sphingomonas sp. KR3-1]|uniref:hypothetical protein n=1 Tax=Sphingomonas sp. KR3-1 TaxID=3156611 RepID=UPI0032B611EE